MRWIAARPFCDALGNVTALLSVVLYTVFFSTTAIAAESGETASKPAPVVDSLTLLRRAGASPADLARFQENLSQMWPDDVAGMEEFVRTQSPGALAQYVAQLNRASLDDRYVPGADYQLRAEVPQGKTFSFQFTSSAVFPGTTRRIRVYIPAEYRADKPACVLLSLDDLLFLLPRAFDNLIYDHQIPTLIAIGVGSGIVDSRNPTEDPRFDRSMEFDGLSDRLARFLLEEVLPEVERHKTPDGLPILLSKDPNDRAVSGLSSGGIAAFTLAWRRPDAFRRVFTGVGTFVGMRGGDRYPVLVRKTEPKPIRIFMEDGANDELTDALGEIGDWWMSNQTMERALEFSGYQVAHAWGEGTHNSKHVITVYPDAMRWLWKDWPKPVAAGESGNTFLKQILRAGADWQVVEGAYHSAGALTTDLEGAVTFWDTDSRKEWRIADDGAVVESSAIGKPYADMAYGPDGRAYVTDTADREILAYTTQGRSVTVAKGVSGSNLVVTHNGDIYLTESGENGSHAGSLWLISHTGERRRLDNELKDPSGITLTPDGQWLAVAERSTHWGYNYRIRPDGSVDGKQQFYWFHVADEDDNSGAGSWVMDRDGRLYAATRLGVQVFDRNGRVRAILPVPGREVLGLTFGGAHLDTLYVSCADHKIYRRLVQTVGALPWATPIKLPPGGIG
jgi:gluconolactonase